MVDFGLMMAKLEGSKGREISEKDRIFPSREISEKDRIFPKDFKTKGNLGKRPSFPREISGKRPSFQN